MGCLTTTRLYAAGICCPAEAPLIHNILEPLPGEDFCPPMPLRCLLSDCHHTCPLVCCFCCRPFALPYAASFQM